MRKARISRVFAWVPFLVFSGLLLLTSESRQTLSQIVDINSQLWNSLHIIGSFGLVLLGYAGLKEYGRTKGLIVAGGLTLALGLAREMRQWLDRSQGPSLEDVMYDIAGILMATLFLRAIRWVSHRFPGGSPKV